MRWNEKNEGETHDIKYKRDQCKERECVCERGSPSVIIAGAMRVGEEANE